MESAQHVEAPLLSVEPGLALLAGATSREVLQAVVADAFACRHQGWTRDRRRRLVQELSLPDDAAAQSLLEALRHLLNVALQLGESTVGSAERQLLLEAAFSDQFPRKLRLRIVTAVISALPGWKEATVQCAVSVPRLLDVHSGVSAVLLGDTTAWLKLRMEGVTALASQVPEPREVHISVDRAALAAAIASASTLRARLSAIAEQQT
jgi:hypothetical protein